MMKEHEVLLLKTGKNYLKILSTSGTLNMLKLLLFSAFLGTRFNGKHWVKLK